MADPQDTVQPGKPTPKTALVRPLGDSGLRGYGGYISEEFLRQLSGERGRRVYREMSENDPTVAAILEGITSLLCGNEWKVTAADETDAGEAAKEFVEEVFSDMDTPLRDVLSEACTMFTYGFAPMEQTYKLRGGANEDPKLRSKFSDGKFGLKSIALRSQTSLQKWEIDQSTGELLGMHQQATWKRSVFIPIDKMALFRTQSIKDNPEGRSLLRRCYRPWYFKTKIEEIEAVGIERDLAGLPMIKIPSEYMDPNADADMKALAAQFFKLVTQVRRDQSEGIMLPSDMITDGQGNPTGFPKFEFKLLTSGGGRTFDTSAIIDRYDRRISTSVLMDFLFLGQQAVGSFALSSDKTAIFAQALKAYADRMADVINNQIIGRLWELNGFDAKLQPKIQPPSLSKPDLAEIANFIATMGGAGMMLFPDAELENHLREMAGLPKRSEDDSAFADVGAPGGEEESQVAAPKPKPGKPAPVTKLRVVPNDNDDWVVGDTPREEEPNFRISKRLGDFVARRRARLERDAA